MICNSPFTDFENTYSSTFKRQKNVVDDIPDLRQRSHPDAYERTRAQVAATGNKWALENFYATHGYR